MERQRPPPTAALTQMRRDSLFYLDLKSRGRGKVGVLSQDLERELAGKAILYTEVLGRDIQLLPTCVQAVVVCGPVE